MLHSLTGLTIAGTLVILAPATTFAVGALAATPGHVIPDSAIAAPVIDIDPDASYQLVIHKHAGTSSTLPHDGTEQSLPAANASLAGARYQVCRVPGIDLADPAGWQAAAALTTAQAVAAVTSANVTCLSVTTGSDGTASADLGVGLYLVEETQAPAGYVRTAAPFLVTLPMTDPAGTSWMDNVHVYPKNQRIPSTTTTTPITTTSTATTTVTTPITTITTVITTPPRTTTPPPGTTTPPPVNPSIPTGGGGGGGGSNYGGGGGGSTGSGGTHSGSTGTNTGSGGTAGTTPTRTINGVPVPEEGQLYFTGAGIGALLTAVTTTLAGILLTKRRAHSVGRVSAKPMYRGHGLAQSTPTTRREESR